MKQQSYHKRCVGTHKLAPETLMLSYGYDPKLSEGAVKTPVCMSSTFAFRTAEEGAHRFRERLDEEVALLAPSPRTTFSAAIAQWRPNESGEALDARARAVLEGRTTGTGGVAADTPA